MAGGGGDELKLLGGWPSPFVVRVRLVLNLKGLSYEYVEEDLASKSELLLKSNPVHNKIPVLLHDGNPICESTVIVQYLDEAFAGAGPPILPSDPYERAVARFWAAYVDDKLYTSWIQFMVGKTEEEKAEAMEQTFAAVDTLEGAFEECSKGKAFFGGDSVGYVDVALGAFLGGVKPFEVLTGAKLMGAARTPLLAGWAERFCALDIAKDVIPEADRLVEFTKARLAAAAAAAAGNN